MSKRMRRLSALLSSCLLISSLTEGTELFLEKTETEEEQILEEETEVQTEQKENSTLSAENAVEESQEIHVTVSVSKDGKFLDDKNGNPMAGREITLTGQASYNQEVRR